MDRLSELPLNIIETILCLVPIQEAGRTSILSKEWRYRWTRIPKIVFNVNTFQVSTVDVAELSIPEQKHLELDDWEIKNIKLIYAAGQVLLRHDGPIQEFSLSLFQYGHCIELDHIITHLSRITSIKKLTLNFQYAGYVLPSSVFSFHQLTHLCLIGGYFDHEPTINELASLTSLTLLGGSISAITLQRLLSRCPLVKTLLLDIPRSYISGSNDDPSITELLECLPVIETLSLKFPFMDIFDDGMSFRITRSFSIVSCYPGIMFEHLNELEIYAFVYKKTRLDFVKFILARSPVLKKVRISLPYIVRDKKFRIIEILLGYSCASPEVQIIVDDQEVLIVSAAL